MNIINENNNRVVILRGCSGSGKSTYIQKNFPNAYICSADHFFTGNDGIYRFDPMLLGEAHRYCYRKFLLAITDKELSRPKIIVVDNTNTQIFEFYGYVQLAWAYNIPVEIIRMNTPIDIAAARNLHGVPFKKVKSMQDRFQNIPSFWGIGEKIVKGV